MVSAVLSSDPTTSMLVNIGKTRIWNSSRSVAIKSFVRMHNRVIDSFPPPYHKEVTPYSQDNFSDEVLKGYHRKVVSNFQNVCKVIVVGDVSVGKTALVNRCFEERMPGRIRANIFGCFQVFLQHFR